MNKKSICQIILFIAMIIVLAVEVFYLAFLKDSEVYIIGASQSNRITNLLNTRVDFEDVYTKLVKLLVENKRSEKLHVYYATLHSENEISKYQIEEYECSAFMNQYQDEFQGINGNVIYYGTLVVTIVLFIFFIGYISIGESALDKMRKLLWAVASVLLQFLVLGLEIYVFYFMNILERGPFSHTNLNSIYSICIFIAIYGISLIYSLKNKSFWFPILSIIPVFLISSWINNIHVSSFGNIGMYIYLMVSAMGSVTGYVMQRRQKIKRPVWFFYVILLLISIIRKKCF